MTPDNQTNDMQEEIAPVEEETNTAPVTEEQPVAPVEEAQPAATEEPVTAEQPAEEQAPVTEEVAKKSKTKRIVGIVISAVCLALVAFLLFVAIVLMVDKYGNKSAVPSFFGTATLVVETGSMEPTIHEGDLIIIKKTNDYKIGDIITFMHDGETIPTTHRIIGIVDGKFRTKGDHNNTEDTLLVSEDEIYGEWQSTVPHVGLFVRWLGEDFGWLYIVAIVAVIVVGIVLLKKIPSDKKEE